MMQQRVYFESHPAFPGGLRGHPQPDRHLSVAPDRSVRLPGRRVTARRPPSRRACPGTHPSTLEAALRCPSTLRAFPPPRHVRPDHVRPDAAEVPVTQPEHLRFGCVRERIDQLLQQD